MNETLTAKAVITIHAPASKVWEAITKAELIKQYLFGAEVTSDWKEGSPIMYKGVYQGKAYEDKGKVLKVQPEEALLITHWSPLSGTADSPENYHQVSYDLEAQRGGTRLTITQDNNATKEEQEQNSLFWKTALDSIKKLLEA
ncbi:MAG: SRPBCC domain-containing protein [Anaerolineales bacterium]|nr:SRPBCC domain-containing protein [Anaerolineales bacterium]